MNSEVTIDKIIKILKQNVNGLEEIDVKADTPLISSGLIESIDFIDILSVLEKEFNIQLQLDMLDFANLENAELIAKMISDIIARMEA